MKQYKLEIVIEFGDNVEDLVETFLDNVQELAKEAHMGYGFEINYKSGTATEMPCTNCTNTGHIGTEADYAPEWTSDGTAKNDWLLQLL